MLSSSSVCLQNTVEDDSGGAIKKPPDASPSCLVLVAMHCSRIRVRGAMLACGTRRRLSLLSLHPSVSLYASVPLRAGVSLLPRLPGVALLSDVSLLSGLPSLALLSGGTGWPRLCWSWRGCCASAKHQC